METIKANVGRRPHRHCQNYTSDQIVVGTLLNRIPAQFGGTADLIHLYGLNGHCRDDLYESIVRFQRVAVGLEPPDGIVEPGGKTLHFLNKIADLHFPVKPITDLKKNQMMTEAFVDATIAGHRERMDMRAPEYLRKLEREKQAAQKKWSSWKERIRRDAGGGQFLNDAIEFLNAEEKRSKPDQSFAFVGTAIGFGGAYVGYDYKGGWELKPMFKETLGHSYDKRKLLVNTWGLKGHQAIILFSNFTHYVMKPNEVVEFDLSKIN
jgi:hypothetical protein